jgi:3-dehydroquinate synthetase
MNDGRILELSSGVEPSSPYYLGDGIADLFPEHLRRFDFDRVALVTSRCPYDLFGNELVAALRQEDVHPIIVSIEEGERNKSWSTLASLCERLVAEGVTRDSIILSLGGGLVGNVTGMAAGLIYRGIRYVEIPTTLMAQTDGVLSNKQAINGQKGKNQFGVYHAPSFIWSDVSYARREPARQTKSAIVEAIKNGLVNDAEWLFRLSTMLRGGMSVVHADLLGLARAMIESKLDILAKDPSEKKYAVVLEYGHTFGHAIEWLADGALYHGEAVGIGMCIAAHLGRDLGVLSKDAFDMHFHVIGELLGSPVRLPDGIRPESVYAAMLADNKRSRGGMKCILLEDAGRVHDPDGTWMTPVRDEHVMRVLSRAAMGREQLVQKGAMA